MKKKVHWAIENILHEKSYISPVDIMIKMDILSLKDYEDWRFGRVQYLERVCKMNLKKLSSVMKEIRIYAGQNHLKPSWTAYNQWGTKGKKMRLRFSKSGNPNIEKAYATHYVMNTKKKEV